MQQTNLFMENHPAEVASEYDSQEVTEYYDEEEEAQIDAAAKAMSKENLEVVQDINSPTNWNR